MARRLIAPPSSIPGLPPITNPLILTLLITLLLLSLTDLILSLLNTLGLTSFFIGLTASIGTIIHILTNLIIIFYRLRYCQCNDPGQSRNTSAPSHSIRISARLSVPVPQVPRIQISWNQVPPTSKVSSIVMDLLLATMFIAAFTTTLLVHILNYFGGGRGGGDKSRNSFGFGDDKGSSLSKTSPGVLYADAAMELTCAILLVVLAVVGSIERRKFQEAMKRIPLGSG